ncbi:MAG: site-specific integrase [Pseudomonadota bacterium]
MEHHRSPRVAYNMRRLMLKACSLRPDLAELPAVSITPHAAEKWAEDLAREQAEQGHGYHYVNDFLRHAQTAYSAPWGRRRAEREYQSNPFAVVDRFAVQRRAKYVPTHQQVAAIKMAADGDFQLYLEILLETGARPGEALALTWFDCRIDADPPSLVLYTQKTAHGDRVPRRLQITGDLAGRLRSWRRQGASKAYLFRQADKDAPHYPVWAEKRLRSILKELGLEWFSVGCFRHYYATTLAHEGIPLVQIQARLGHSSLRTTERYIRELVGV